MNPLIYSALNDLETKSKELRRNKLAREYNHDPYINPLDGVSEAFATGLYEMPGQWGEIADEYTTLGAINWLTQGEPFKDRIDKALEADQLDYNPADYGADPMLQGLARLGGGLVGEMGIPAISAGSKIIPWAARNNPRVENMFLKTFNPRREMTTYHGGPHHIKPNAEGVTKFDHSKMGTGEGAQAYGWGTYLAENPDVAKRYRELLRPQTEIKDLSIGGIPVFKNGVPADYGVRGGHTLQKEAQAIIQEDLLINEWAIREAFDAAGDAGVAKSVRESVQDRYEMAIDEYPEIAPEYKKILDKIDTDLKGKYSVGDSHLYEVDLPDEKIAQMLDWDAPLSEQPHIVKMLNPTSKDKKFLELSTRMNEIATHPKGGQWAKEWDELNDQRMALGEPEIDLRRTGEEYVRGLQKPTMKEDSEFMRGLGIPGIKYFDGTSRSAGKGTRNFVVFDENDMTILSRNGEKITQPIPMDEASRMQRARDMGFDKDAFHYSRRGDNIEEFHKGDTATSIFDAIGVHTGTKQAAIDRAENTRSLSPVNGKLLPAEGATYPLKIREGNQLLGENKKPMDEIELQTFFDDYAEKLGVNKWTDEGKNAIREAVWAEYDSIPYINMVEGKGSVSYITPPKNMRSKFAKFDPAKKDSANLLDSRLLPIPAAGLLSGITEPEVN